MSTSPISLAIVYKEWDQHNLILLKAIQPLSEQQLTIRLTPQLRSAGELISHIIAVRARWLHYVFKEQDALLPEIGEWDREDFPPHTVPQLIEGLQYTWNVIDAGLHRWTTANLEDVLEEDDDGVITTYTRQWLLWHLIEHDIHHSGELSFLLGAHNLTGLTLN